MKNDHIGSKFDDFLKEDGILEECKEETAKRILVWQLQEEMKQHITTGEIAKRIHTSLGPVNKILDLRHIYS